MSTASLIQIALPLMLALLMWGLGLHLKIEDFKRVKTNPKPVYLGLFIQLVIIPLFAYLIGEAFQLPPVLAAGLFLLSAGPGGPSANLFSHLSKGNVALNVTLTAINSVLSIVYLPAMMLLTVKLYLSQEIGFVMQAEKFLQVVLLLLVPVSLGMWMNHKNPALSKIWEKRVNILSAVFLIAGVVFGIIKEHELLLRGLQTAGLAVLCFNVGSLAIGYLSARVMKLPLKDAIAIMMELGIHNCIVIMGLCLSPDFFNNIEMGVPAGLYAVMMYVPAGLATVFFLRYQRSQTPV